MTDKILIDRATLEQLVTALEAVLDDSKYANELTVTGGVYEGLQCKEALTAGRAALANAERVEPDTQLCKFYDVATYPDLVAAMEKHITKLQARTPPLTGEAFTQKPRFA